MKAMLVTLCGCTRLIEVDESCRGSTLTIPMRRRASSVDCGPFDRVSPIPMIKTRTFQWTGQWRCSDVVIETFEEME